VEVQVKFYTQQAQSRPRYSADVTTLLGIGNWSQQLAGTWQLVMFAALMWFRGQMVQLAEPGSLAK
jgi:hypothetical protein